MITILIFLLIVILLGTILFNQWSEWCAKIEAVKNIKGPKSYFLIGNLDIFQYRNDLWGYFQKFQALYPRVYRTCIGPNPMVVTDDYAIVDKVLQSKEMLDKPAFYKAIELPYGLIGSEYPIWVVHRKVLDPAFHIKILEPFIPIFIEKSANAVERLKEQLGQPEFDLYEYTLGVSMDNILATTMGSKDKNDLTTMISHFRRLTELVGQRMFNIFLRPKAIYKLTPYYREDKFKRGVLYDLVNKIILDRKNNTLNDPEPVSVSKNKPQILIDKLQSTLDENGNCVLRTEEIREECYIMVAAGVETTGLTLASTILLLAIHQDVQDKVYKEIITVNPKNETPNMDMLNDMTYMSMVIFENLRLIPTIPVIGRKALEDFDIGDGVLKRGMTIYMNIFSMHRNQDVWGKDSNDFKPERFMPEEIEKRPKGSFTPFGRGQRTCIGKRYAMISLKIMLADLLRNYKFTTKLKMKELEFGLAISIKVMNKHFVQIERRTP